MARELMLSDELNEAQLKAANRILHGYGMPYQHAPASVGSILSAIALPMELGRFTKIVRALNQAILDADEDA